MEEFKIIGKLDINKLGKYKYLVTCEEVILTDERKKHIIDKHRKHYDLFLDYLPDIIYNPDYILEDTKNENTIMLLKEVIEGNKRIKVIIKLAVENTKNRRFNSIITYWNIRERDYDKTIAKGEIIYKKLDKNE